MLILSFANKKRKDASASSFGFYYKPNILLTTASKIPPAMTLPN